MDVSNGWEYIINFRSCLVSGLAWSGGAILCLEAIFPLGDFHLQPRPPCYPELTAQFILRCVSTLIAADVAVCHGNPIFHNE